MRTTIDQPSGTPASRSTGRGSRSRADTGLGAAAHHDNFVDRAREGAVDRLLVTLAICECAAPGTPVHTLPKRIWERRRSHRSHIRFAVAPDAPQRQARLRTPDGRQRVQLLLLVTGRAGAARSASAPRVPVPEPAIRPWGASEVVVAYAYGETTGIRSGSGRPHNQRFAS